VGTGEPVSRLETANQQLKLLWVGWYLNEVAPLLFG